MASLLLIRRKDLTGEEFVVLAESDDREEHKEWLDLGYEIAAVITIRQDVRSWPTDRLWQVT